VILGISGFPGITKASNHNNASPRREAKKLYTIRQFPVFIIGNQFIKKILIFIAHPVQNHLRLTNLIKG